MVSVQDDQTEIFNPGLFKLTLLWLEVELVLVKVFQDKASDLMVFFQHFGVDEDVVAIYTHYVLCNEVPEDVIHHGLECGGAVGESKEHHKQSEQSSVGLESSLPLVSFLNVHIVVTPLNIQFNEASCTPEVVDELGDEEEEVAVLHHYGIGNTIILNQLEQAILLLDEEDWRSH
ncbi:hypothetical protein C0989_007610 [Termitomyces sp. Mn162]|nr:hypothetical protein C0989_007610 [Termitomyces sp. Mn162]